MTLRDDGNKLVSEYSLTSAGYTRTKDYYTFGNQLVTTLDWIAVNALYWVDDHLGTPRYGDETIGGHETHDYQPFGQEIGGSFGAQPLKFASMERDQSSGNDYDHARYGLTGVGRFLGVDKGGSGSAEDPMSWNRYEYSRGNPLVFRDPNGDQFSLAVGFGLAFHDPRLNQGVNYMGAMSTVGANAVFQTGIAVLGVYTLGPAAVEMGAPTAVGYFSNVLLAAVDHPSDLPTSTTVMGLAGLAGGPVEGGPAVQGSATFFASLGAQKLLNGTVDWGKAILSAAFSATGATAEATQALSRTSGSVVRAIYSSLADAFSAVVTPKPPSEKNPDTAPPCKTQLFGCTSSTSASQP